MSDNMKEMPGGVTRQKPDPALQRQQDFEDLIEALKSGQDVTRLLTESNLKLSAGMKKQFDQLKADLAELGKESETYRLTAKELSKKLAESNQFERVRMAADQKNREFDRKQSIQKREFEKNNVVAQRRSRQEQSVGHHLKSNIKNARRSMSDSLTEKTIGRIPGIGGVLSSAILEARRAKRQEKDQDRQDKIRDKEEALLDDLRADFERRQKKAAELRQAKSRGGEAGPSYGADFEMPSAPRRSRSTAAGLNLIDADVTGAPEPVETPISGKLPSSLRPRPGEVLRKNSAPLGLVMLHNDLLEMGGGFGSGKGGKKKEAEAESGGMGEMIGKLMTNPYVLGGIAAALGTTLLIGVIKGKLDENQKIRDENTSQISSNFMKTQAPELLNKDFSKSSDAERMKAVKALQAKIDKEGKGFMMKARYNVATGKVDVDTSKINEFAGTGTAVLQNEAASKTERYKAAAESTYGSEGILGHRGTDQEANDKQIEALAKAALGDISKAKTMEDIDVTSMKDFLIVPNKDGTYTFTNPRTKQSINAKLTDEQKVLFGNRYIKKHADFLSDRSHDVKWSLDRKEPLSKNDALKRFTDIDSMSATDLMAMEYGVNMTPQYNPRAVFDLITSAKDPQNIPTFHQGGIAPHEMPAILRRDEMVLNPAESKIYAQQKIDELENHRIGDASGVSQDDVVAAIEKLISVLEGKNFEPKINVSSRGGSDQPIVDFNGMRTV